MKKNYSGDAINKELASLSLQRLNPIKRVGDSRGKTVMSMSCRSGAVS